MRMKNPQPKCENSFNCNCKFVSLNCETIKIIPAGDEKAMYDRVSVTNLNIGWRDLQKRGKQSELKPLRKAGILGS